MRRFNYQKDRKKHRKRVRAFELKKVLFPSLITIRVGVVRADFRRTHSLLRTRPVVVVT